MERFGSLKGLRSCVGQPTRCWPGLQFSAVRILGLDLKWSRFHSEHDFLNMFVCIVMYRKSSQVLLARRACANFPRLFPWCQKLCADTLRSSLQGPGTPKYNMLFTILPTKEQVFHVSTSLLSALVMFFSACMLTPTDMVPSVPSVSDCCNQKHLPPFSPLPSPPLPSLARSLARSLALSLLLSLSPSPSLSFSRCLSQLPGSASSTSSRQRGRWLMNYEVSTSSTNVQTRCGMTMQA